MSREDRNTLINYGPLILKDLTIDAMFLAHLKRSGTLNEERAEDIKVLETHQDRNAKLLSILPTRGPSAFKNFIFALVDTNQRHIAEALISPQNIEQYIKQNSASNYAQGAVHGPADMNAAKPVPVASPMQELSHLKTSGNAGSAQKNEDERDSNFGAENAVSLADGPNDPYGPEILIEAKPLNADVLKKMVENPERYYKMSSCRAIILNNEKFLMHKDREGSSVHLNNARRLFEKYGYTVDVWQDLTADKIEENINKERENLKSKKFDGFVFVIMSHGRPGHILGIDGKEVSIKDEIIKQFDGENCKVLIGKPKIFIIQACQGTGLSEGVKHCNEPDDEGEALEEPDCWELTHEKADMIEVHSTYPGFKALRNRMYGSHFIRSIVRNVYEHAHEEDFYDIMTKVKRDVVALEISLQNKLIKQIPSSQNDTLIRKFYFPLCQN